MKNCLLVTIVICSERTVITARWPQWFEWVLGEPGLQTVGVNRGQELSGYLSFSFEKGPRADFLSNSIHLRELVYETTDDLSRLLTFLNTQADQIEHITYNTQDEAFFYLLQDPRQADWGMLPNVVGHKSSTQGLGIMYRVLSVPRLFEVLENHNFGDVSCQLEINLRDSFFPENAGSYKIEVVSGKARAATETTPEVTLSIDVADFSSLVIGAVPLHKLASYGLATLSDVSYLGSLDRLFSGPKPICLTSF